MPMNHNNEHHRKISVKVAVNGTHDLAINNIGLIGIDNFSVEEKLFMVLITGLTFQG